jgi:hypothetical protein
MSLKLPLSMWLALSGCIVDETGYGDPPHSDDLEAIADPSDNPAGRFNANLVKLTSEVAIGPDEVPVVVVGLPGSVAGGEQVELSVGGQDPVAAAHAVQGFVGTVHASLGQVVTVWLDGEVVGELEVAELQAVPPAHEGLVNDAVAETDTDGVRWPGEPGGAGGVWEIPVGDGDIPGVEAPYVVFDATSGASVAVAAGDVDATLPVTSGDRVCVAKVEADGALGTATCVVM